ncbi:MAG: hypothetical protein HYT93_00755 [Parcubacteria group bacterium]|nr:hypothetical protein [Parcubacteria group bacterium]
MPFSKDHNRGKEKHVMGEHGLTAAIQNWRNAVAKNQVAERRKQALAILAHLGGGGRKLGELIESKMIKENEAEMIRADARKII